MTMATGKKKAPAKKGTRKKAAKRAPALSLFTPLHPLVYGWRLEASAAFIRRRCSDELVGFTGDWRTLAKRWTKEAKELRQEENVDVAYSFAMADVYDQCVTELTILMRRSH